MRKFETDAYEGSFGQRFAEARGYVRTRAERCSTLDPRTADTSSLESLESEKRAEGFRLVGLGEVRERPHDLYVLVATCEADVPSDDPATSIPYEDWLREGYAYPDLDDDASFVVLAVGGMVALSLLYADRASGVAQNEMTGTLPGFRRRGLARLAKLASIRAAADLGIREIWTANDLENAGMLALNEELGYEPRLVTVELAREV